MAMRVYTGRLDDAEHVLLRGAQQMLVEDARKKGKPEPSGGTGFRRCVTLGTTELCRQVLTGRLERALRVLQEALAVPAEGVHTAIGGARIDLHGIETGIVHDEIKFATELLKVGKEGFERWAARTVDRGRLRSALGHVRGEKLKRVRLYLIVLSTPPDEFQAAAKVLLASWQEALQEAEKLDGRVDRAVQLAEDSVSAARSRDWRTAEKAANRFEKTIERGLGSPECLVRFRELLRELLRDPQELLAEADERSRAHLPQAS